MNFSRTERALQSGAVVVLAILILIILSGQIVKHSGPAEWLSALLNLVIASAAVMAFITARSWLPQLTTQEGYKLAISLVNDEFIWLGKQNRLFPDAGYLCAAAGEAFNQVNGRTAADRLAKAEVELNITLATSKKRKDTIEMAMFRMKTYGLQVSADKAICMATMLQSHTDTINKVATLLSTVRDHWAERERLKSLPNSYTPAVVKHRQNKIARGDADMVLTLKSQLDDLRESWHRMTAAQETFTGGDHRIGKLFIVRKG